MTIDNIKEHISQNSLNLTIEFKRLFHGRGGLYKNWKHLSIDSIDTILSITLYKDFYIDLELELTDMLKEYIKTSRHNTIVLQRRYLKGSPSQIIVGTLKDDLYVVENDMKFKLNLLSNQNNGYFPDMKNGRVFVRENAKGKRVLNLFSYTCAFSIAASLGGAKSILNIDMSKSALTTGRANHHLNNIDTKNIKFYPYNILKSFGRIKRDGPYDLIIIDPPTLQKGSFEATKDYAKIIKKLTQIASKNCIVLACLNSPELGVQYLLDIFNQYASEFKYIKRVTNIEQFATNDQNSTLKNLIFKN